MSLFDPQDAAVAAPVGAGVLAYGLLLWVAYLRIRSGGRARRWATYGGRFPFAVSWHKWGALWVIGWGCLLLGYALVTVVIGDVT